MLLSKLTDLYKPSLNFVIFKINKVLQDCKTNRAYYFKQSLFSIANKIKE